MLKLAMFLCCKVCLPALVVSCVFRQKAKWIFPSRHLRKVDHWTKYPVYAPDPLTWCFCQFYYSSLYFLLDPEGLWCRSIKSGEKCKFVQNETFSLRRVTSFVWLPATEFTSFPWLCMRSGNFLKFHITFCLNTRQEVMAFCECQSLAGVCVPCSVWSVTFVFSDL